MTTHAAVAESPEVKRAIPALAELAATIGDAELRQGFLNDPLIASIVAAAQA